MKLRLSAVFGHGLLGAACLWALCLLATAVHFSADVDTYVACAGFPLLPKLALAAGLLVPVSGFAYAVSARSSIGLFAGVVSLFFWVLFALVYPQLLVTHANQRSSDWSTRCAPPAKP